MGKFLNIFRNVSRGSSQPTYAAHNAFILYSPNIMWQQQSRNVASWEEREKSVNMSEKFIHPDEVKRFMVDCMTKVLCSKGHATQLAEVLTAADVRGHYSHGLNRLNMYVNDVQKKVCKSVGKPIILKEQSATAWVDGNNLLGPVVGNYCIDLAVKKAKDVGVGWVAVKGSNHFGIAGWYSMRAMENNCIGFALTNTSPIMYPTRSSKAALGTNPLAIAAKGKGSDSFVLDMATTTVAIGKVEIAIRKSQKVAETWGVARDGSVTTDPCKIMAGGGLLPLGGGELEGGYKGYGLAAGIDILCGVLAGAHWGPNVRSWMVATSEADLGQCFVAVNCDAFAPNFNERLQEFMDTLRSLPKVSEEGVLVAGDLEREHIELVEKSGGIPYHASQLSFANSLASDLGVPPMKTN